MIQALRLNIHSVLPSPRNPTFLAYDIAVKQAFQGVIMTDVDMSESALDEFEALLSESFGRRSKY